MLLRYAACDDHNMTTTIAMIALSGVGGRWRWPVAVSGGRCPVRWPPLPVTGVRCPVAGPVAGGRWLVSGAVAGVAGVAGVRWPVSGGQWLLAGVRPVDGGRCPVAGVRVRWPWPWPAGKQQKKSIVLGFNDMSASES